MKHIEETDSGKNKNNLLAKEVEKVEKATPFHCPFCVRKFSDATECEKHIPRHTQTFQCTLCPKNFHSIPPLHPFSITYLQCFSHSLHLKLIKLGITTQVSVL